MKLPVGSPEWVERLRETATEIGGTLTRLSHAERTTPLATYLALTALARRFEAAAKSVPRKDVDEWLRRVNVAVTWDVVPSTPAATPGKTVPVPRFAVVFFRHAVADGELLAEEAYGKGGVPYAWLFQTEEEARRHAAEGAPEGATHGKVYQEVRR